MKRGRRVRTGRWSTRDRGGSGGSASGGSGAGVAVAGTAACDAGAAGAGVTDGGTGAGAGAAAAGAGVTAVGAGAAGAGAGAAGAGVTGVGAGAAGRVGSAGNSPVGAGACANAGNGSAIRGSEPSPSNQRLIVISRAELRLISVISKAKPFGERGERGGVRKKRPVRIEPRIGSGSGLRYARAPAPSAPVLSLPRRNTDELRGLH